MVRFLAQFHFFFLHSVLLGVCTVACSLFWFAFPKADECIRAADGREMGVLNSLLREYFVWTGRWSGLGISYLVGSQSFFEAIYPYVLFAITLTMFAGLYCFLGVIFRGELSRAKRCCLTLSFLVLYWSGMPSVQQSFYWMTGSIENQLSLALSSLLVTGLLYRAQHPERTMYFLKTILFTLALVIPGMHEFYGVLLILVLGAGTLFCFQLHHPCRKLWALVTLATVIGVMVVVIAPGNVVRMKAINPPHDLATLKLVLHSWRMHVSGWMLDPRLLLATLLLLSLPQFHTIPIPCAVESMSVSRLKGGIFILLFAAALILVPWWAPGRYLPGRTWSALYYMFLWFWFSMVFILVRSGAIRWRSMKSPSVVPVLFAISLLSTGNFVMAVKDVSGSVFLYRKSMLERYELIRLGRARGEMHIRVPPLASIPSSFNFVPDLLTEESLVSNPFRNRHMTRYFGLKSLAVKNRD